MGDYVKTLLEETLEKTLIDLDMPLGERVYGEDLDFEAEMEDIVSDVKTSDNWFTKIFDGSKSQLDYGRHNNMRRRSFVYKGLGFVYGLTISHKEESLRKDEVNSIIANRNFGKFGSECIDLYYSSDFSFPEKIGARDFKLQHDNRFYDENLTLLSFEVTENFEIIVENNAKYFGESNESYLPIAGIVDEIVEKFNGKFFNESIAKDLSFYLKELKEAV